MPGIPVQPSRSATKNLLLQAMPAEVVDSLWPQLEWTPLTLRTILLLPEQMPDFVYFIEAGSVSMVSTLDTGEQVEIGLVGREGFVGLPVLLGAPTSPIEAMVQAEGGAWRLPASAFRRLMTDQPSVIIPLLRYVDSFLMQVSQTAVCNVHHQIEQRLARWILMTQDRVEADTFPMRQQFLSLMLGVQRPSVTLTVGTLARAGLINHVKGEMHVLDRVGLEAVACECYDLVRRRFAWLQR